MDSDERVEHGAQTATMYVVWKRSCIGYNATLVKQIESYEQVIICTTTGIRRVFPPEV